MALRPRKKQETAFDPDPGQVDRPPLRPYRVLHAGLTFYSDPGCKIPVEGAKLAVLRCEDPAQKFQPVECLPTRKEYRAGQVVTLEFNNKMLWEASWYVDPNTGQPQRAWAQSVEFVGRIVAGG